MKQISPESYMNMKMVKGGITKSEAIQHAEGLENLGEITSWAVHPVRYGVPMNPFESMWGVFVSSSEASCLLGCGES